MTVLNPLSLDTATPPIPEAKAWTKRYAGSHGPLINLSQAVPGDPPHASFLAALSEAAGRPEAAQYGDILGDADLRGAYAAEVSRLYGSAVAPADVAITSGCNQAFFATMIALAKAGDAVLLPTPWYFNHEMTLHMLGIEARPLPCRPEHGFVPDVGVAEGLLDDKVKAIVLVTPNNPTGAIYPPAVIEAFADLCERRGLWLVVDETYRDYLPQAGQRPHGLFARPRWRDGVISLYSFSKAYCIPGHRLGAIIAGPGLMEQVEKIMDCVQICPARVGQMALVPAIAGLADWREGNRREIAARAEAFVESLANSGWRIDSIGAYFAYVAHPYAGRTAGDVAKALAEQRGVLGLPGSFFGPGQDTHLRIAFANVDRAAVKQIGERLAGFVP